MGKAMLILLEIPESCKRCRLSFISQWDTEKRICIAANKTIIAEQYENSIYPLCPLKPMEVQDADE